MKFKPRPGFFQLALLAVSASLLLTTAIHSLADAQPARASIKGSKPYQLAFEFVALRQDSDALEAVGKLDSSKPDSAAERLAIEAWVDFTRARFEAAKEKALSALAKDSKQPLALLIKARLLASENSLDEAVAAAHAAAKADPDNPVILWWAAEVLGQARKDSSTKIQWVERVIALGGSPEIPNSIPQAKELLEFERNLAGRPTEVVVKGTRAELPFTRNPMTGLCTLQVPWTDGRRLTMMLDTGANSVIVPAMALQNTRHEVLGKATAYQLSGPVSVKRVLLESFSLDGLSFQSVTAGVLPTNSLLGMNLFRDCILVIDLRRQRLVVFTDPAAFEKEWGEALKRADKLSFRLFKNNVFVPATATSGGAKAVQSAIFLDTGANMSAVNMPFAKKWNREMGVALMQGGAIPIQGAAGAQQTRMQLVQNVAFRAGNTTFGAPQMPVIDLGTIRNAVGFDMAALIGMNMLGRREFLITDYPRRHLYIGPPAGR